MNGEPNNEGNNGENQAPEWRKYVNNALFTLIGGVLGAAATGFFNLEIQKEKSAAELNVEKNKAEQEIALEREKFQSNSKIERQKLDEDLIKMALQPDDTTKRTQVLQFMAETHLISEEAIRNGVEAYLAGGKTPPQFPTPAPTNYKPIVQFLAASDKQLDWAKKVYQDLTGTADLSYGLYPPKIDNSLGTSGENKVAFFNPDDIYLATEVVNALTSRGLKNISLKISKRSQTPGYIEVWLFDVPES
jgi:hypothetical protein